MPQIPIETTIQIFLTQNFDEALWKEVDGRALVAVPDVSNWNDFNKNFHAELHFVGFQERHSPVSLRLMFEGASHTSSKVAEILDNRAKVGMDLINEPFVSVLADTASYRILVERLGFTDSFASLRCLHDAVVTRLEAVDEETLGLAQSIAFVEGVLREDMTWAALRQGDRYLTPNGAPDVDDAAQSFDATVQLYGMRGKHVLDADFGKDFPLSRRILVLVGENGVGKTRLINSMIEGLQIIPDWDVSSDQDSANFDSRPKFSTLLMFSSAGSDPYPSQLPPWRGVDYRFHRMNGHSPGGEDDLTQSLLDCMRLEGENEGLGDCRRMELLDDILKPLGIKKQLYVEVSPDAGDSNLLPPPIRENDRLYLSFFGTHGEQRRLQLQARMIRNAPPKVLDGSRRSRNLSSGEQALLRFAVQAIGSLRSGTMFFFDEPETHLHPRYVSIFMSMLDRLLELSGSVALIATHSAYIVREVPARRVRIVRKDRAGEIVIEPPRMQTFGASIDTISQFVFGDIMLKHRFQEVLDQWLIDTPQATVDEFRERFQRDLNAETLSYLAQIFADRQPR